MCGIVGIVSNFRDVAERVLSSIKRLEYRGYDSAGIATINSKEFQCLKNVGKVGDLERLLKENPIAGNIGIGHTRWATHGAPTYLNTHPFISKNIALVHNGIIDNYLEIKKLLVDKGYKFHGETDSEVLLNLIQSYVDQGANLIAAINQTVKKCEGLYSFILISNLEPDTIIGIKKGLPLAIGIGEGEMYFGSDAYALFPLTNKLIYLSDGEIAYITSKQYKIIDLNNNEVQKEIKTVSVQESNGKQDFQHFMLKEIYEQSASITRCFNHYYDNKTKNLIFQNLVLDWKKVKKFYIIACGSSYYSACVAKYWLEEYAKINVEVDIASEFRYRNPVIDQNDIFIFISQSGETADIIAALKLVKEKNNITFSITNTVESSIGNLTNYVFPLCAGPEVSVASTKTFTCQLMVLAFLSIYIAYAKGLLSIKEFIDEILKLREVPDIIIDVLNINDDIRKLASSIKDVNNILYIGRGASYPIASEGALKMKELSYISSLGLPAGELKHGSIALIDNNTPICIIAPSNKLFNKVMSNLQEAHARNGKIILFSDKKGIEQLQKFCFACIELPSTTDFSAPIIYAIPMQLLAYHLSILKGNDVDQPRNLAKSVTVE